MSTTTNKPRMIPLQDFIENYVEGEPLNIETVKWAVRQYIYMNYEPSTVDKIRMYEAVFYEMAKLLDGNQPKELQILLTNIRNWAYARRDSNVEQDEYKRFAIQNETFYNLLKTR